jgi:hypothetical protein
LTPATIELVLLETRYLSTAWRLANAYLLSCGGKLLAHDAPCIVGLSEGTTCYVSTAYFLRNRRLDDFVVHEARVNGTGTAPGAAQPHARRATLDALTAPALRFNGPGPPRYPSSAEPGHPRADATETPMRKTQTASAQLQRWGPNRRSCLCRFGWRRSGGGSRWRHVRVAQ